MSRPIYIESVRLVFHVVGISHLTIALRTRHSMAIRTSRQTAIITRSSTPKHHRKKGFGVAACSWFVRDHECTCMVACSGCVREYGHAARWPALDAYVTIHACMFHVCT